MKKLISIVFTLILSYVMLMPPVYVAAQQIQINLPVLNFGSLEIGMSEVKGFRIIVPSPAPLIVYNIELTDDSSSSVFVDEILLKAISGLTPIYQLTLCRDLIFTFLYVLVEFSPELLGIHGTSIFVECDAVPLNNQYCLPLTGIGVESAPIYEPSTFLLLGAGLLGVGLIIMIRNRKRSKK